MLKKSERKEVQHYDHLRMSKTGCDMAMQSYGDFAVPKKGSGAFNEYHLVSPQATLCVVQNRAIAA